VKTSPPTILASTLRTFFGQHLPLTRGLSPKTILSYRDAFVLLLRFLATRHPECLELCQRLLAIPTKRTRIAPVAYLEGEEICAMLNAVDLHQPQGQRDRALLLTLFNTGARVQEILDVRPVDLQLERPFLVRLRGKGRKERICPLWPKTMHSLRALLTRFAAGPGTRDRPNLPQSLW
jgi:integrase/recombinase XerD